MTEDNEWGGGRVFQFHDLDRVAWCPMGETCESCATTLDLDLTTVSLPSGVACITLCDECKEFQRLPKWGWVAQADRVAVHCGHLRIDLDRMGQLIEAENRLRDRMINEVEDGEIMPCQPIGCDNGYHLPNCYFGVIDE